MVPKTTASHQPNQVSNGPSGFKIFFNWYKGAAAILLTTCLLLGLINIALGRILRPKLGPGTIAQYGWQPVLAAYPGWTKQEITVLLSGFYFDGAIEYEPFTQFRERPRRTKYVSVDPAGFRIVKNQGPWPPSPAYTNIFVFGGSTTFGYGVANEETIPSWLQELAPVGRNRKPVRVYNFGRGYYFSAQEATLFQRLLVSGRVPDVAIFIDGINDFYYSSGNPEYTGTLTKFLLGEQSPDFLAKLPINRAALFVQKRIFKAPRTPSPDGQTLEANERLINSVVERWYLHRRITEAVAASFGVRTVFVWQPAPTYKYDLQYHAFYSGDFSAFRAHKLSRAGYAYIDQLRRNRQMGDDFLWLSDIQETRTENLYVDLLHYRPDFSREIARCIDEFIEDRGWL